MDGGADLLINFSLFQSVQPFIKGKHYLSTKIMTTPILKLKL